MDGNENIPSQNPPWEQRKRNNFLILLLLGIALAALGLLSLHKQEDHMRARLLTEARMAAKSIDWRQVKSLSGTAADFGSEGYQRLKEQISMIHEANPQFSFCYLLGRRPDKSVFHFVDSEPPGATEYSPPGTGCEHTAELIIPVFSTGKELVIGSIEYRRGERVAALVPVTDPQSGNTLALFGVDRDIDSWNRELAMEVAERMALYLMILAPLTVFLFLRQRSQEALSESRQEDLRRGALVERLNCALVELAGSERIYGGDIEAAFRAITEASAKAMDAGRVSVWFYTGGNSGIVCKDMYEARRGTHSEGMILYARDYPAYFSALEGGYCLCAADALRDPRTSGLSKTYLKPLGITSMLDVPIIVADKTIGLVCHEHTGAPRKWTVEEQSYATAVAGFASMSLEILARKRAEESVRKLNEELERKVGERTRQLLSAQEELIRKEKLAILGQLSGSVGHELRNPLGVMSNAVFYLKMVLPGADEKVREYLDIIKNEIDNSQRIISDLLDFARTKKPQIRTVTVRELVKAGLDRCPIPENVAVEILAPENIPPLKADPLQMGQVFQNLFVNAVQAMPGGGVLRVGAQIKRAAPGGLEPDFVEISAADTGEGITEENLGKIFQPLFTTKAKGMGLGLVVCRNLTELNGGKIRVESRPGEGTVFTVSLPVAEICMGENQ